MGADRAAAASRVPGDGQRGDALRLGRRLPYASMHPVAHQPAAHPRLLPPAATHARRGCCGGSACARCRARFKGTRRYSFSDIIAHLRAAAGGRSGDSVSDGDADEGCSREAAADRRTRRSRSLALWHATHRLELLALCDNTCRGGAVAGPQATYPTGSEIRA